VGLFVRGITYGHKNPNKMPILWQQQNLKKWTQQSRKTSIQLQQQIMHTYLFPKVVPLFSLVFS